MAFIMKGMEFSERRNAWMNYTENYGNDCKAMLDNIASEFNAPRKNGYIPVMSVATDNGNVIVTIEQKLSNHMLKKQTEQATKQ